MSWASPQWAWVWILSAGLGVFLVWAAGQRRRRLEAFVSSRLYGRLVRGEPRYRRASGWLLVLSTVFIGLGLMRPTLGFHWEETPSKGKDIFVLIDISRSMLASDVSPDRLTWAKRKVLDLAALVPGDRIGLIGFSGNAFLALPLTSDSQALPVFLDNLSPESTTGSGTAISSAIDLAVERLAQRKMGKAALLILSDGEDHGGGAEESAKKAAAAGVSVFAIGVGRPDGAPIPIAGGGFQKTNGGELVLTRLDEPALRRVTQLGGGAYWRSGPGDGDLQALIAGLSGSEVEGQSGGRRQVPEERFQWALALAVLLLLVEALLQDGLPRLLKAGLSRRLPRAATAALCLLGTNAWSADLKTMYEKGQFPELEKKLLERQVNHPGDTDLLYDLGNTFYRQGKFAEAEQAFAAAAGKSEGPAKERAVYNRGNAAFRANRLEDAIGHYESAVALDPKDEDAKFNLAFAKKRLEQQKEQQQKPKDDQKDQKDQKKDEKPGDGDKKEPQKNADSKSDPKDGDKDKQGQPDQKDQKDPKQADAGEKKEGQPKDAKPGTIGEMPKEEAEAWLSRLREKRNAKHSKARATPPPGGKDW